MADRGIIQYRDKRNGEPAGPAQRVDNALLGVTRMGRIRECSSR
jgi:hypothetical protein